MTDQEFEDEIKLIPIRDRAGLRVEFTLRNSVYFTRDSFTRNDIHYFFSHECKAQHYSITGDSHIDQYFLIKAVIHPESVPDFVAWVYKHAQNIRIETTCP